MPLKLQQAQVWKVADGWVRIVRLERLAVDYLAMPATAGIPGTHHRVTKKEFCRLIKGGALVTPVEAKRLRSAGETQASGR